MRAISSFSSFGLLVLVVGAILVIYHQKISSTPFLLKRNNLQLSKSKNNYFHSSSDEPFHEVTTNSAVVHISKNHRTLNDFVQTRYMGNPCTAEFPDGKCEECTGDCDNDNDCAGELRCAQRWGSSGNVNVPGCTWSNISDSLRFGDDDFCK